MVSRCSLDRFESVYQKGFASRLVTIPLEDFALRLSEGMLLFVLCSHVFLICCVGSGLPPLLVDCLERCHDMTVLPLVLREVGEKDVVIFFKQLK